MLKADKNGFLVCTPDGRVSSGAYGSRDLAEFIVRKEIALLLYYADKEGIDAKALFLEKHEAKYGNGGKPGKPGKLEIRETGKDWIKDELSSFLKDISKGDSDAGKPENDS